MATTVFIPTPLRRYAENNSRVVIEAGDVDGALRALIVRHPALRDHLFDSEGALRSFVNIYLNDEDIRYMSEARKLMKPSDTISIIPAIAGGVTR